MKNFLCQKSLVFCFLFLLSFYDVSAQCPVADFTVQSPVCEGQNLMITNLSHGNSNLSYEWDFCPGYFRNAGNVILDSAFAGGLEGLEIVKDSNEKVVFMTSKSANTVYRLTFGNGFDEPYTMFENLYMITGLSQPAGIKVRKENNAWYAIVINYGDNSLLRVNLGATLHDSVFTTTLLADGTVSQFNGPRGLDLVQDSSGNSFAAVTNMFSSTVSIVSFGNSITNLPTVSAPSVITGSSFPLGIKLIASCSQWYGFVSSYNTSNVIRLDFGTSLLTPPVYNVVALVQNASGIDVVNDSSEWRLIVSSYTNQIFRFTLGSNITNINSISLGTEPLPGATPRVVAMVKENGKYICMIPFEASSNLITLSYSNSCGNSSQSTDSIPTIASANSGDIAISLTVTDQFGRKDYKTSVINVLPAPHISFATSLNCFGDSTSFLDSTTIATGGLTSWAWGFGDSAISYLQSPKHFYSASGTYPVSLTVTSSLGCSSSDTILTNIFQKPVATFFVNAGCSSTPLAFNDNSTSSTGTIMNWKWQFGNGDTSVAQNPVYAFPVGGAFQVTLIVTSDSGCSGTTTQNIQINDRPLSAFNVTNTCIGSSAEFNNLSSISGSSIVITEWDFGDGTTGTTLSPTHAYPNVVDTYNVKLVAIAANGCADSSFKTIKINNVPVVSFSAPLIMCQNNEVQFTDLSLVTGDTISGWVWDFGDGENDTVKNPVHIYPNFGMYNVSLTSYSPSSCPGAIYTQLIDVKEGPVASFNFSTTCEGSVTHFLNNSTAASSAAISSVLWRFSSMDSSSIYSPDFMLPVTGNYPVTLDVISTDGCTSRDSDVVVVHARPNSSFTSSIACTGSPVQFTNTSHCDSLSSITQYDWNFGDFSSSANNSTLIDPSHQYTNTLIYTTSLIATTNFGCLDTSFGLFQVNASPPVNFTYSPTCLGNLMEFFNPGSSLDSSYYWNFGDHQNNQLREPAHYYSFAGTYTVTLTVTASSGCTTVATKQVSVSPIPMADFQTSPACVNNEYQFIDLSTVASGSINEWNWSMTDLPSPDSIQNPVYMFTDTGRHNVTLEVVSDIGCKSRKTKVIEIHNLPTANFSIDPQFGVPPLDIQTTDYSQGAQLFIYDFGDGTIENLQEPTHTYIDTGTFIITQYVTSAFGCIDSISKDIHVTKPILDIAITSDSSYFDGDYFHVVARIANLGTRDINSVKMEAYYEGGNTISEIYSGLIPYGTKGFMTYEFHASFLVASQKDFNYYCIKAMNPNGDTDNFPENNEMCINFTDDLVGLTVFPNPSDGLINLQMIIPHEDNIEIDIYNNEGKNLMNLFNGIVEESFTGLKADLRSFNTGIYMIRIKFGEEEYLKRIMISHD